MISIMEIKFQDSTIELKKKTSEFEEMPFLFFTLLNKEKIKYATVAGYLNILFGRPRTTEDIDVILEKGGKKKFKKLWEKIHKNYECINTPSAEDAFNEFLDNQTSLRFSKKRELIPNIEIKFPRDETDYYTLKNRKKVTVNDQVLYIGPIELQIAYKLYLGTEKDIEDARFIYQLFKEKLDKKELNKWLIKLEVEKQKKYLGENYG